MYRAVELEQALHKNYSHASLAFNGNEIERFLPLANLLGSPNKRIIRDHAAETETLDTCWQKSPAIHITFIIIV